MEKTGAAFVLVAVAMLLAIMSPSVASAAETMVYTPGTHSKGVPAALVSPDVKNVVETNYPAAFGPVLGDETSYVDSKNMGVQDSTAKAAAVQGPVVLGGHSQGAVVAVDTAENLHKEGLKPDSEITYDVYSDGRLTGTGAEVVLEKYSALLLPITGGQLQGERTDMGDVKGESTCRHGDGVCNMEDPATNPLGAACGGVGYLNGYHGYTGTEPTRDVQRGNTLVHIIDAPNPCIPAAEKVIGGPVTAEFAQFVDAVAPISDPGSPELSSPDLGEVVTTGFNAAAAAVGSPVRAPELPNLAAENSMASAPMEVINTQIEQLEEQFTNYTAPETYTAPQTNYEAPATQSFDAPQTQQVIDTVNAAVAQFAPEAAPMVNDIANQFAAFAGR